MQYLPRKRPLALAGVLLVTGCANLQTRPGHPDSYMVGLSGGNYYKSMGLQDREWRSTAAGSEETPMPHTTGSLSSDAPPAYKASPIPHEIWQARGAAWNLHLKYLAASFKAGEVQDVMAVPLFGAGVATVALGIAKAGTVSLAATGLGGASLYAGYSYLHPDKDASTDQTAAFDLVCVVDQSLPLRAMSGIPLMLDKAALQDSTDQLAMDSGPLMALTSPNVSQKAAQQAVTSAQAAASKTMVNLDTNINLYNNMPTVIYSVTDQIDKEAETGGVRAVDYPGILSSLNASALNKSANATAQSSVAQAKQQSSAAASPANGGMPAAVAKPNLRPAPAANLNSLTTPIGPGVVTALTTAPSTSTDPGKGGTDETTATSLTDTLTSTATSDLQKINKISADANEDLAGVDYGAVAANIQGCTTGQIVVPLITPQSQPVTGTTNTGS